MDIDVSMNIENTIFQDYKTYIIENSKFNPLVIPFKSNRTLTKFPTITFKEENNVNNKTHTTIDRSQRAYSITNVIEIYTKDLILDNVEYASKVVMDELKYLTFDFFEYYGCDRTDCTPTEYINKEVDRLVIIYKYNVNNWNRKISQ